VEGGEVLGGEELARGTGWILDLGGDREETSARGRRAGDGGKKKRANLADF